jgi:hypothetical protein
MNQLVALTAGPANVGPIDLDSHESRAVGAREVPEIGFATTEAIPIRVMKFGRLPQAVAERSADGVEFRQARHQMERAPADGPRDIGRPTRFAVLFLTTDGLGAVDNRL